MFSKEFLSLGVIEGELRRMLSLGETVESSC